MPKPRLPYLQRAISRHGRVVWYVRQKRGHRTRIRAPYGTPEFIAEYQHALSGTPQEKRGPDTGTLGWLFDRYRETTSWFDLSPATRRQRENILAGVLKISGTEHAADIDRGHIVAGRDRRAATPAQARNFLDAMRGLFRWAHEAGHVKSDPTAGVKNPARPKTGGFPVWSEADVDAYESRWPIGTKERVWLAVLLYSGLRRGDAVKVGRQHVKDGTIALRTEKTGQVVTIPILPELAEVLATGPCGQLTFICGASGRPFVKESFGTAFGEACRAAGINKSAHGVRKIGATRAAENGATVAELEAIFAWSGGGMASLYTKAADRARLAKGAIGKLARPSPSDLVRATAKNRKK